ncbi:MAG: 3-phosphoshikimate 1-carboxyvinyltransferase [Thermovenabulum sp.]|uniref:3-phosphoshikimate 1-carboxyvinyltransferase n=1 Tax=Thermovenabulum sp. TaxID=3100335 RepID=UPI003C7C460C
MDAILEGKRRIKGEITAPPDKSISHRSVMLGAIAEGVTEVERFLPADDCLSTVECFRKMGIDIRFDAPDKLVINGRGLRGLKKPDGPLYAGNSGTTIRLLSGILAGQSFEATITGDESLLKRPMGRVVEPLSMMGAVIEGACGGKYAPLTIRGGRLRGIRYELPVASAQVKSAILLAGLYAEGETTVIEKHKTRDHTEIMLAHFGSRISAADGEVRLTPVDKLSAGRVTVPGDISSAAFFMVAAAINEDSELLIKDVGINPTRTGIIDVLRKMGCDIKIHDERIQNGEKVANLFIKGNGLCGTTIEGEIIPRLIDEIPVIAVAAAFAEGETVIRDAGELRVKESDRIKAIADNLRRFGADVTELEDGLIIRGGRSLKPAEVESFGDHRIAMAMAVAALSIPGVSKIKNAECVKISFPDFFETLGKVSE